MKLLLLVAAAVGLGAMLAGNVLQDVTRYLRIRRMQGANRLPLQPPRSLAPYPIGEVEVI